MRGLHSAAVLKGKMGDQQTAELGQVVQQMHQAHAIEDQAKTRELSEILTIAATYNVPITTAKAMRDKMMGGGATSTLATPGLATPPAPAQDADQLKNLQGGIQSMLGANGLPPVGLGAYAANPTAISPDNNVALTGPNGVATPVSTMANDMQANQHLGTGPGGRFENTGDLTARQNFIEKVNQEKAKYGMPPSPIIAPQEAGMPTVESSGNGDLSGTPPYTGQPMPLPPSELTTTPAGGTDVSAEIPTETPADREYRAAAGPHEKRISDLNAQITAATELDAEIDAGKITDPAMIPTAQDRTKHKEALMKERDLQQKQLDHLETVREKKNTQMKNDAYKKQTQTETHRHNLATETGTQQSRDFQQQEAARQHDFQDSERMFENSMRIATQAGIDVTKYQQTEKTVQAQRKALQALATQIQDEARNVPTPEFSDEVIKLARAAGIPGLQITTNVPYNEGMFNAYIAIPLAKQDAALQKQLDDITNHINTSLGVQSNAWGNVQPGGGTPPPIPAPRHGQPTQHPAQTGGSGKRISKHVVIH